MLFEWDRDKNIANVKKHGISFELAATIFDDPFHLSILDRKTRYEARWITAGQTVIGSMVVVAHTYKETDDEQETIRIISARQATRKEKKQYEEGI